MVCTRVVVAFVLTIIVQAKTEQVLFRGTADDGTYSEVRASHAPIPGGLSKTVSSFSSRVLTAGGSPGGAQTSMTTGGLAGAAPGKRMLGLPSLPFGQQAFPSQSLPSQNLFNPFSMLNSQSGTGAYNPLGNAFSQLNPGELPQFQQQQQSYEPYANEYYGDGFNYRSQFED